MLNELYHKILRISFKIIISNIMYLNVGVKMHEKVAALNVVHYIHVQSLLNMTNMPHIVLCQNFPGL